MVGDDFSLYYDAYSVDERVDSDSKVCWCALLKLPYPVCSFPLIALVRCPVLSATVSSIPYLISFQHSLLPALFAPFMLFALLAFG